MMIIHDDCRYFEGHIPCRYHKLEGVHCQDCPHYDQITTRILIIKLGALGDVIRTTPLLKALGTEYPNSQIFWLTLSPEFLPATVDKKLPFSLDSIIYLEQCHFDVLINLDKDAEACALAQRIQADKRCGFTLRHGVPAPVNSLAEHKFLTGLFDDLGQANTKSYPQEIFEICGLTFQGEKYDIALQEDGYQWDFPSDGAMVGLNTGCGRRWLTRLWPEAYWSELASQLMETGYHVLLLGGPDEHEKNQRIQAASKALYPGTFPLNRFMSLLSQCDLVVTTVTMALHVAIALEKKIVLLNNIFNRHEFELYGLGRILEPPSCTCYFAQTCDQDCMADLKVAEVYDAVTSLLPTP
ncbi:MAG: glycosyltransferase family 9 protein [Fidelibacterota bacterium]|nr:MAG: glycosyltransferase family 9 protein [Candidatus Neomarinimicrobiota bacterium]